MWSLSFNGIPTWSQLTPTRHAADAAQLARRVLRPPARPHPDLGRPDRERVEPRGLGALARGDAGAWTKISPASGGPGGRYAHTTVYDAGNDRLILFGGLDVAGNPKNDVWALSLAGTPTWTQLTPAGTPPSARYGAGALFDRARQRMVLFAGGTGTPNENDAWALTLGATPTWTKLTPSGPPQGRQFHTVSYDPIGDRLLAYGGSSGSILSDTWALPLASPTAWVPLSGTRRKGHSGDLRRRARPHGRLRRRQRRAAQRHVGALARRHSHVGTPRADAAAARPAARSTARCTNPRATAW